MSDESHLQQFNPGPFQIQLSFFTFFLAVDEKKDGGLDYV